MSLLPYWCDVNRRNRLYDRFGFGPEDFDISFPRELFPLRHLSLNTLRDATGSIRSDKDKFQISVDVQHFAPEEITVKTTNDGYVTIEGKHEEKRDEHGFVSRQFVRRYKLPEGCIADTVQSGLSSDGVLTVTAPRKLALPDQGERIVPIQHTGPVHRRITTDVEVGGNK